MKVILKEDILTDAGNIKAGTIIDLPEHIAQDWINKGKAKAVPKIEKAMLEPSEKRRKKRE